MSYLLLNIIGTGALMCLYFQWQLEVNLYVFCRLFSFNCRSKCQYTQLCPIGDTEIDSSDSVYEDKVIVFRICEER